ncbi:hypothetical protein [Gordonia hydrophobica]|uniref:Uncharacterized protein n=1 Tax=Gordonia hydrophobica TaxID=40516 RepID=A0ABZ2TXH5_9ACTN|nr:hypothetical protein [Gordonia hydrophobica]MBM7366349.1 hypothetical protein [Gordonia hydrophobica]
MDVYFVDAADENGHRRKYFILSKQIRVDRGELRIVRTPDEPPASMF